MSVVVSREPGIDAFRYLLMMPVILAHPGHSLGR